MVGGRLALEEDNLWWKTTHLAEYDLWRKTTFCGRRPLVEDDLHWKRTFSGRQPSVDPYMLLLRIAAFFIFMEVLVVMTILSQLQLFYISVVTDLML